MIQLSLRLDMVKQWCIELVHTNIPLFNYTNTTSNKPPHAYRSNRSHFYIYCVNKKVFLLFDVDLQNVSKYYEFKVTYSTISKKITYLMGYFTEYPFVMREILIHAYYCRLPRPKKTIT